jgi:trans-aconitate methyltransferase
MLDAAGVTPDLPVIDVGAGASRLVDALLGHGFSDVTALDVSNDGLARARERLGAAAGRVRWVVTDLLTWTPQRRYAVWHDRAVFHFLTDPADQALYRSLLDTALAPGARVVIGAFARSSARDFRPRATPRPSSPTRSATLSRSSPLAARNTEPRQGRCSRSLGWPCADP